MTPERLDKLEQSALNAKVGSDLMIPRHVALWLIRRVKLLTQINESQIAFMGISSGAIGDDDLGSCEHCRDLAEGTPWFAADGTHWCLNCMECEGRGEACKWLMAQETQ